MGTIRGVKKLRIENCKFTNINTIHMAEEAISVEIINTPVGWLNFMADTRTVSDVWGMWNTSIYTVSWLIDINAQLESVGAAIFVDNVNQANDCFNTTAVQIMNTSASVLPHCPWYD